MIKLSEIKGLGPAAEQKLARLGIVTLKDLLMHIPRQYHDFSALSSIADLKVGSQSIVAQVTQIKGRFVRRGLHITEAVLSDGSSSVKAVWFNQPYLAKALKKDRDYVFSGDFVFERQRYQLLNPSYEAADSDRVNAGRLLAIYPETKGLSSKRLRRYIHEALNYVEELGTDMPEELSAQFGLMSFVEALQLIHRPDRESQAEKARRRLAFSELVGLALSSIQLKAQQAEYQAVPISFYEQETKQFVNNLPFKLTPDQRSSSWQVIKDLQSERPMNRLLDGDVGSGKTVVAAIAIKNTVLSAKQAVLIAPTTILAEQHFKTLEQLMPDMNTELLVSAVRSKAKAKLKKKLKDNKINLLIGTHAVLEPDVDFSNLGLIIIDEQHRFGVEQRRLMQQRLGLVPHVLTMSATPIPRTLALTLYGELDISRLKTMPPNRQPIETFLYPAAARRTVDEQIKAQLKSGGQAYVVTPLIEDSDSLNATSLKTAYDRYLKAFNGHRVEFLHGKMKDAEKQSIMKEFADGEIDILVSTTVIEVGIDVANATVMVIESAERFGLAQLHQLRGRVGRGSRKSICFLITSGSQKPPKRLEAVVTTTDGFELAELDLELRGPGAIYGTRQSGALDLRIASLTDNELVKQAQSAAKQFHESGVNLLQYPQMASHVKHFKAITHLN